VHGTVGFIDIGLKPNLSGSRIANTPFDSTSMHLACREIVVMTQDFTSEAKGIVWDGRYHGIAVV
jgi:hypothetical protein